MQLETGRAQQTHRAAALLHGVPALVQRQDAVIQALNPQLHLGDAQAPQPQDLLRRDPIGSRLDDQSHVAMRRGLIVALRLRQVDRRLLVHGFQTAQHERFLVVARVG